MSELLHDPAEFPALSSMQAQVLVGQCADVTLSLSYDMTVTNVIVSPGVELERLQQWAGQKLDSVIALDSQEKLSTLLNDNSATMAGAGRWRHLNFVTSDKTNLPLLVKFFRFVNEGIAHHLICARDLRPMFDVQERVKRVEKTIMAQPARSSQSPQHSFKSWKKVANVIAQTASSSIDDAVNAALLTIEKLCISEALAAADGDHGKAAELLDISVSELIERLK